MKKLIRFFQSIKSEEDLELLFRISFTEKEIEMIKERWKIFDLLEEDYSQRDVAGQVKCSVVTVTRGAKNYRQFKKEIDRFLNSYRKI